MKRTILPLLAGVVVALAGCGGSSGMDQTARDFMAYDTCTSAVKDQLKAPSTADFQGSTSVDYRTSGGNNITVTGYVDAENGFGAKLRSNFTCSMDVSSDGAASNVQASVDANP